EDHPTALAALVIAVAVVAGFVILVALLVLADQHAAAADGEQDAGGGAVPPGEDLFQHAESLGHRGRTMGPDHSAPPRWRPADARGARAQHLVDGRAFLRNIYCRARS